MFLSIIVFIFNISIHIGSSFPKAKPKHGLSTVACLAFQRLLFFPLYKKWWIQQTSYRIFVLFLLLYSLQTVNVFLYYVYANRENETEVCKEIFLFGICYIATYLDCYVLFTDCVNVRSISTSRYDVCFVPCAFPYCVHAFRSYYDMQSI